MTVAAPHSRARAAALFILCRAIGAHGEKGVLAALLAKMQSTLSFAWTAAVRTAINSAVKGMRKEETTSVGMTVLLNRLRRDLATVVDDDTTAKLTGYVDGAYTTLKRKAVKKLGVKYSFQLIDKRAVEALGRENPFWVDTLYDRHLSARISEIGRVLVVEEGLGVNEGAVAMRRALERELALRGGGLPLADVVPSRYAGNVAEYTRILTSNVANRARNFSAISSYTDAKIERYRITAILDDRTSEICQYMNGKEFTVESGRDLMERMIDTDPEGLKEVHPWVSADRARKIAGKGTVAQQNTRLASGGLNLPPYHGRCRTLVEAVS